jgi:alpha-1,2-mannosyltransferase
MMPVRRSIERFPDKLRDFARPWEIAAYIWVPAIAIAYAFWWELRSSSRLQDFGIFRVASRAVIDGRSPYPAATVHGVAHFDKFVYPAVTAVLFAPLAELPLELAQIVMLVLGVLCVFIALRLFGVRDWRCYGVAVISSPAVNSLALGAVTSFMLVGVAAAWRYRDRPALNGVLVALTAVVKLFLWPLGLWLLATRRLRATAIAIGFGLVMLVAGWAAIGFAGLRSYPHLLRVLSQVEEGTSYSPVALLHLSSSSAGILTVALGALLVCAVLLAAWGVEGDRRALAVAVIGSLLVTPIVWLHYFLLLLVPIALYRPRLSPLWFAPVLLWATPSTHSHGVTWHIALALSVTVLVAVRTTAKDQSEWLVRLSAAPVRTARRVRPLRAVGQRNLSTTTSASR